MRKIKDRVRHKYSISLSEVGGQQTWQRAVMGFAVVGGDRDYVTQTIGKVAAFVESLGVAQVSGDEREVLVYGDEPIGDGAIADVLLGGASPSDPPLAADESWIPEAWREDDSDG